MPRKQTNSRRARKAASLAFNHAMVYTRDIAKALGFYRDLLGFRLIEQMEHGGHPVYARLRGPRGTSTIALHLAEPGTALPSSDAVRLYFEVKGLKTFCARLAQSGVPFSQMPKRMPWGWDHAYLNDPDGHEISLYWAGDRRFRKSSMRS